jgi:hypothetical protein
MVAPEEEELVVTRSPTREESSAVTLRDGDEKQLAPSDSETQPIKPRSRCNERCERIVGL